MSALGLACQEDRPECARVLLEARADVDGRFRGGVVWTPLMLACDSGHSRCVELLLDHSATTTYVLQHDRDEKGEPSTAMEFAEWGEAREGGGKLCAALLTAHLKTFDAMKTLSGQAWEGKHTLLKKRSEHSEPAESEGAAESKDVAVALGIKEKRLLMLQRNRYVD